ncbi:MAG: dTDP-4-dehydrorhamnose reductase [Candidatus Gastranaerophilales bacterium]|nr:dTDP-4-dehydrorhamnose reductase [Candidatus Gastranaerophilales bacterium]
MNKILITGANGQLGTELSKLLPDAISTDINELDICNYDAVMDFIKKNNIKTIINAAAYNAVDNAEDEFELAHKVNVIGAKNLAKTNCDLIHISTDYVFDGENHKPYLSNDATNPISVYGKTKRDSEIAVLENNKNAIIIRTSWLYSTNGNNFVKTIRKLAKEKAFLNVVYDQVGSPTSAFDLACAIVKILPQMRNNGGIYHFTNEGVCSWYDFAKEIVDLSELNCSIFPISASEYPTKAKRPFYSILDKTKIKETFNLEISYWKDSLKKCIFELENCEKKGVCQ